MTKEPLLEAAAAATEAMRHWEYSRLFTVEVYTRNGETVARILNADGRKIREIPSGKSVKVTFNSESLMTDPTGDS
jgi:hypothetical protein